MPVKEPRVGPRHRAAQTRQIMQLAEHTGERRLSTLVRTRDDKDALGAAQEEVIADDRGFLARELAGEREIVWSK